MDYSPEWDLSTIPKDEFYREARRRQTTAPRQGARKPKPCRYCKEVQPTKRIREKHQAICPENPRVKKILAAQKVATHEDSNEELPSSL